MEEDKRLIINVGGTNFETFKSTLIKSPYFKAMLSGHFRDDKEDIFIDRDPELFKHVLRYLRDPTYDLPFNTHSELLFYGIEKDEYVTEPEIDKKDIILTPENYDDIFSAGSSPLFAIVAPGPQNEPPTHHSPFHKPHEVIRPLLCAHGKFVQEMKDGKFTITRCADLLYSLTLQFKIVITPKMPLNEVSKIRYQLFDAIDFGWHGAGDPNFRITKHLLQVYEQLFLTPQQRNFISKLDATGDINIKLPYWFINDPALSLSLITNTVIQPTVKIKELIHDIPPPKLIMEQIYLNHEERKEIRDKEQNYPIKQWQILNTNVNGQHFDAFLPFNHPCDLFIITLQKDGEFIPLNTIKMYLNNRLFIDTTGNQQLLEMSYQNMFPDSYIYTLSLKHGSINLTRIDECRLRIGLTEAIDNGQLHVFARNSNVLRINKDYIGVAYST
jgi:hypothetical protein